MKQWFTARELAELQLPSLPQTHRGINKKAETEAWHSRPRQASGGGSEYPIAALPDAAQVALIEKLAGTGRKEDIDRPDAEAEEKSQRRRDARVIILQHLEIYRMDTRQKEAAAVTSFVRLYNARAVATLPPWIFDIFETLSDRTIWRWKTARREERYAVLGKSQNNRFGTGVLDVAEDGKVAEYLAALIVKQPHLTSAHLRDLCIAEFGDAVKGRHAKTGREFEAVMPDLRTFRRWVKTWRTINADLFEKLTNPDAHKNKNQMAIGRADADIERLNQRWEIDASPADVLCSDGRHSVYAIVDVWSRRAMFVVSRTATTEASLRLVRKAVMAWGVPETLKTDNGADFTSYRFSSAILHLGIEQQLCRAFTPESKPFVERAIRTMQHSLMPLLPGYIGHNVADRKQIEARKAFAQRLGEDSAKAFAVSLSSEELQARLDQWAEDKYAHTAHDGIGMTPFAKAASWIEPIKRITNERAVDLLLAPIAGTDGFRTVTKKGLKIDGAHFYGPGIELHVGKRVMVRFDNDNMGRVFVFNEDHEFICEAINYDRDGADRVKAAAMAKASQREMLSEETAKLRRAMRKITPEKMAEDFLSLAAQNAAKVTAFPKQAESYSTPSLDEAARAVSGTPAAEVSEEQQAQHDAFIIQFNREQKEADSRPTASRDEDRWWDRAMRLISQQEAGQELSPNDASWLEYAKTAPWFVTRKDFEAMKKTAETEG